VCSLNREEGRAAVGGGGGGGVNRGETLIKFFLNRDLTKLILKFKSQHHHHLNFFFKLNMFTT